MIASRAARYALVAAAMAAVSLPGCRIGEENCLLYACVNAARVDGSVSIPEATSRVDVRYCGKPGCVEGSVDIAQPSPEAVCAVASATVSSVCLTRASATLVEVEAQLSRPDDGTLPPDGEEYSLRIVDAESGEVLVDETRTADYEVTREDSCHLCWSAEMAL